MALYQNGILISGANTLPKMTLAEYQALPVSERPTYWERTDLNYSSLPASDVTYDSTTSGLSATRVQGAIDELAKPTFTEASTRANIASGDSFSTILGKIKKFFTDLKTVAFTGSYTDLSGTPDLTNVAYKNVNNAFTANQTINRANGTAGGSEAFSALTIGNSTGRASAKSSSGYIQLYRSASASATTAYPLRIFPDGLTATRDVYFQDKGGVVALTSDIPSTNAVHRILYTYLSSQASITNASATAYASSTITLPAGNYLLFCTTWAKTGGTGSCWLSTYAGNTVLSQEFVLSENTIPHCITYCVEFTSAGNSTQFKLCARKGNATSVIIPPYHSLQIFAIKTY